MPDEYTPSATELSPRARALLARIEQAAATGGAAPGQTVTVAREATPAPSPSPSPSPEPQPEPTASPPPIPPASDDTDRLLALVAALSARTEAARRQLEELTAALEILTERLGGDAPVPGTGHPAATPMRRAYDPPPMPPPMPHDQPPPPSLPSPPAHRPSPPSAPGASPLRRPAPPPVARWPEGHG
jgi:hypothetical protein